MKRISLRPPKGKRLSCERLEDRMMLAATPVAADWLVELPYGTENDPPGAERLDAAVDAAGNLAVMGWFTGTVDFDPSAGTHELTATLPRELFVAKYDVDGALVNAVDIGDFEVGPYDPRLAVDDAGAVYITSQYRESGPAR